MIFIDFWLLVRVTHAELDKAYPSSIRLYEIHVKLVSV